MALINTGCILEPSKHFSVHYRKAPFSVYTSTPNLAVRWRQTRFGIEELGFTAESFFRRNPERHGKVKPCGSRFFLQIGFLSMLHPAWNFLAFVITFVTFMATERNTPILAQVKGQPKGEANRFKISPQTSYLKTKLRPDGIPDYGSAIDAKMAQGVTAQNNACIPLYQAIGPRPDGFGLDYPDSFFERLQMQRPPKEGKYVVELDSTLQGLKEQEKTELFGQFNEALRRPWQRKEFPAIARWLDENKTPLGKIHEAVQRDHYFLPLLLTIGEGDQQDHLALGSAFLPGVYLCRHISSQLCARSMLHLGEANQEAAWRDLLASLKLARLIGQGPTPDEAMVAYNMENITQETILSFIQQTQPTPQEIHSYRQSLDHLPSLPLAKDKLNLAGRCACLEAIMILSQGHKDAGKRLDFIPGLGGLTNITKIAEVQFPLDWDVSLRIANQWYDRVARALEMPLDKQRQKSIQQIRSELKAYKPPSGDFLRDIQSTKERRKVTSEIIGTIAVVLILTDQIHISLAQEITRQKGHNLQLAMALAAFRSQHAQYPDKLGELVPSHLQRLPLDVFSGKTPIYRRKENGYHLYSVGPNRRDDGGQTGQKNPAADDLSVRNQDLRH